MNATIKIYDYLGNLIIKKTVEIDFFDNEAYYLIDLLKEQKVLNMLIGGFKYYTAGQRIWINVESGSNLHNVIIFPQDFERGKLLSVRLYKNLQLKPIEDPDMVTA